MKRNRVSRLFKNISSRNIKQQAFYDQNKINRQLTSNLTENIVLLKKTFHNCSDVFFRELILGNEHKTHAQIICKTKPAKKGHVLFN
jgi:hypothetical protein